ncbi:MAG: prolyl-tRNA synthetase associated domain-containing protein [Acidobacteria bacterium]|nr:prolyl-tRNA synthetase associated domain-containing protein [Acidobacteriota bacterium]
MTNSSLDSSAQVQAALDALGVPFERHEHPAVYTVDEATRHWAAIEATHCKNLFLRNKKGNRHYLVVAEHTRPVDLARLATLVGDDRLSFASPERLLAHLGLTPGSVSPFGLLNDVAGAVVVVVDAALREAARVAFHPNVNTATVVLSGADFVRFLASRPNAVRWVRLG